MRISDPKLEDRYYRALVERDASYLGTFFAGVRTTSVVCIPTCRARKPRRENVEFYTTLGSAMSHGYRPCKVCRPTENAYEAPDSVKRAIDLVRANRKERIPDARLRRLGISPEQMRRWFNRHYRITFHAFQRMHRINDAIIELNNGKNVTVAAFDSGYESLSGFGYTFRKLTSRAPSGSARSEQLLIHRFTTPLGPMFACASTNGLCLLEFVDRRMLETEFEDLQRRLDARILAGENDHIRTAEQQLAEYFDGKRTAFSVPLDTPGTDFQLQVWQALLRIPFGTTSTYQRQAESLGNRKAVRAVARANGMNRVAIIVPCHRVIGKDNTLVGYAGGLERKRWLLEHERSVGA
jgi:AraC family transcriptional regulator, regulatory protein of adaptative response / methylated-DNA-[protein]-cysteine methyltransferase